MLIRRVVGDSMLPTLRPGSIVIARRRFFRLRPGDVVIIRHDNTEKIKRLATVDMTQVTVLGDNPAASTDSRHFGPLPRTVVIGKVIRLPLIARRHQ